MAQQTILVVATCAAVRIHTHVASISSSHCARNARRTPTDDWHSTIQHVIAPPPPPPRPVVWALVAAMADFDVNTFFADFERTENAGRGGSGGFGAIIERVVADDHEKRARGRAAKKAERERVARVAEERKMLKKQTADRARWKAEKAKTRKRNKADGVAQVWVGNGDGGREIGFVALEEWRRRQSDARKRQRHIKAALESARTAAALKHLNDELASVRGE